MSWVRLPPSTLNKGVIKLAKQKVLVCAAWPYVHAIPHLGNVLCIFAADSFARFYNLTNREVVFVSGSDQHGTKMEFEAKKLGITPKELVMQNHKLVLEYLDKLGISFKELGKYNYTDDPRHHKFVKDFYERVYKNGHITTKTETQLYCEACKVFLADRFIEGTCPKCSSEGALGDQCDKCGALLEPTELKNPKCAYCKNTPVPRETKNWYLDLPKLESRIKAYVNKHKEWPKNVKNFTDAWLKEGLNERPITRDVKWAIKAPFPGAENKTIYVWAEAVLGYLSAVKILGEERKDNGLFASFWKDKKTKSVFTMGKDNIPFHSIILPALLIAADDNYNLPDFIYSTEYLTFDGQKFSKTRGIGVWLDQALEIAPADYWRYYLLATMPEAKDIDLSLKDFETRINSELIGNFGNFVHRTLTFVNNKFNKEIPKPTKYEKEDKQLIKDVEKHTANWYKAFERYKVREALNEVLELSSKGNEYFQKKKPWEGDAETTIYLCANLVKVLSVLIAPFLPFTSEKIGKFLNTEQKIYKSAKEISAIDLKPRAKISKPEVLFQKLEIKEEKDPLENIDIKIGRIISVEEFIGAKKPLYKIKADFGKFGIRQTAARLVNYYSKEELQGKKIAAVLNLPPRKVGEYESQFLTLGVTTEAYYKNPNSKEGLEIFFPEDSFAGDSVSVEGVEPAPAKQIPLKDFEKLKLHVENGIAMYKNKPLKTKTEVLKTKKIREGEIG